MADPNITDWLQAVGGLGGAATAIGLGVFAARQTKAVTQQAEAAQRQVQLMQAEERQRAADQALRDQSLRDQIKALSKITDATTDAARSQLQPLVLANAHGPAYRGPHHPHLEAGQIMFEYYLTNEGTGPALNIRHGVEIAGVEYEFGGGMQFRTAKAGEFLPPLGPDASQPVPTTFLSVVLDERVLQTGWDTIARTYWARFENVFGETFETYNPKDPTQPFVFQKTTLLSDTARCRGSGPPRSHPQPLSAPPPRTPRSGARTSRP